MYSLPKRHFVLTSLAKLLSDFIHLSNAAYFPIISPQKPAKARKLTQLFSLWGSSGGATMYGGAEIPEWGGRARQNREAFPCFVLCAATKRNVKLCFGYMCFPVHVSRQISCILRSILKVCADNQPQWILSSSPPWAVLRRRLRGSSGETRHTQR